MRYLVDAALCSGHGNCAAVAGAVFSLDDDGYNAAASTETEVPAGLTELARRGADECPDQAIRLQD